MEYIKMNLCASGQKDKIILEEVKSNDFTGLTVLPGARQVLKGNNEICLSSLEFDTLLYLIINKNIVLSKEQIYQNVWKHDTEDYINAVTCVIYKLRKKIEPDPSHPQYLQTVRGVGYRLSLS